MPDWISRFFSLDDLWSVLGYGLLLSVNMLTTSPMPTYSVSLLASGMITIVWVLSAPIRSRNLARHPNIRVVFWATVAAASAYLALR